MIAADPFSAPETRRDHWGRYMVLPPTGSKLTGYTRATTITKTLDDGGGLIPWKATATMVGALRRAGLLAAWQALAANHPDPWYGSDDSKKECKRLVEACAEAGGSTDRATLGTALHSMVERLNRGHTVTGVQPDTRADLDAYSTAVAANSLRIDPEFIERIVVLDSPKVAGTPDMLFVEVPRYGPMVGDLKTGANLDYGWGAIAIQLAIYAHGDHIYTQGPAADGSEDRREPMPQVSQTHGLIIHLPAGEARCELHLVDLVAGWEAFDRAMWVRGWRSNRKLHKPYTPAAAPSAELPLGTVLSGDEAAPSGLHGSDGAAEIAHASEATLTPADELALVRESPDEGAPVDAMTLEALRVAHGTLDAAALSWLHVLRVQAAQHLVDFLLNTRRTVRRWEITRGLVLLCQASGGSNDVLRGVLALVIGDVAHFASVTPGHLVGSLDVDEAARFAAICRSMADGELTATVATDGHISLHPAA